jgi:hypothetical protein
MRRNNLKSKFRGDVEYGSQFKVPVTDIVISDPKDEEHSVWYQINISPEMSNLDEEEIIDIQTYRDSITRCILDMEKKLLGTYEMFEIKLKFDSTLTTDRYHFHGKIKIYNMLGLMYFLHKKLQCNFCIDTIADQEVREAYENKYLRFLEPHGINGGIDNKPKMRKKKVKVPDDKRRVNKYGLDL